MGVRFNKNKHYKTENLMSDQEKWDRLSELFGKKINKHRTVFQPTDDFYSQPLTGMAEQMLEFAGVNLGQDQVYIGFSNDIDVPGLYFEHDGVHNILIKQSHSNNALECAAILAHELMHYVLIGGMNYRLEQQMDNEQLTDMATVYAGLGLVVLNGFDHEGNNWIITIAALFAGVLRYSSKSLSFGYYQPKQYAELVAGYIDDNDIDEDFFAGYVMPGAAHFLPQKYANAVKRSPHKSLTAVNVKKGKTKQAIISTVTGLAIFILIAVVRGLAGGGTSTASPQLDQHGQDLKASAESAKSAYESCEATLQQDKNALDQTNSQMNTYNSDGDVADYNALVPQQNQQTNTYNSQLSNCNDLYTQQSDAVDAYNNYIKTN